jgi:hypothetical protein
MSRGLGPRLLAEVNSDTAMCHSAPDLTSLMRWATVLPRVPRSQTSPPCWGELRCCHVSRNPGSRLLAEASPGAATRSSALDLVSLLRWASVLPRVPRLRALPSWEGSFAVVMSPTALGGLWTTGIKERFSCPRHAARLACFQGTLMRYWSACRCAYRYSASLQCSVGLADHSWTWLQWWYDPTGRAIFSSPER